MDLIDAHFAFICATPLITALIGWLTNKAAIWMLFHPREPVGFGPFRVQGLVPRRRDELARKTADLVSAHLLSPEHLHKAFANIDAGPVIDHIAQKLVYEGLEPRLAAIPMIGGMIVRNSIDSIHKAVREKMRDEAPQMQHRMATQMASQMDLRSIIEERIRAFEAEKLEELIRKVAAHELRGIERSGAVLGFVIGLVQAVGMLFFAGAF